MHVELFYMEVGRLTKCFVLQQDTTLAEMEVSLRSTERGIVVPDLEFESEVPVALCTPVQQILFTAGDDFISGVELRCEVLSEAKTVSDPIGT